MILCNPQASHTPYPERLRAILNIDAARQSRAWLRHWSGIRRTPTPLWSLPGLAETLEIASLAVKDESCRSPLGSFKALGAPLALKLPNAAGSGALAGSRL